MLTFNEAALLAIKRGALKKIIFSRPNPKQGETLAVKISARLCENRGKIILAAESFIGGNTVSQKNYRGSEIDDFLAVTVPKYGQVNLLTTLGDAELKTGKRGEVALGLDKLSRKLQNESLSFEIGIEALDKKKNYILKGDEPFLIALGVSDKGGRVHDKKQGKFRQINKFLEYIEEIYPILPSDGELLIYDLCCGKSYLSFAVYHFLTVIKSRKVYILGIDLKKDVMEFCNSIAKEVGFSSMNFITDDITNTPHDKVPDMVISLHACDVATDIVLDTAVKLRAKVILSTPCCHRELSEKISSPELSFVTKYPKLNRTLCDALTDALRLERLKAFGYEVSATELVDPDDTPKNTLLRAIRRSEPRVELMESYTKLLEFLMPNNHKEYVGRIEFDNE